jgi:heme/copper-type cytochrome/quinol oxidase subunit 1
MRLQLARSPEASLIGPDLFNQIFTMHGTTMMFLFAVPIMQGVGGLSGSAHGRVAQHRLPAPRQLSATIVYLAGGVFIWIAFALNVGPDVGWFAYVPLSGPEFSPGKRADFWAQMITFTEVASLAVAMAVDHDDPQASRAPGMTIDRIPLFVWSSARQFAL